jgi:protein phosphatase
MVTPADPPAPRLRWAGHTDRGRVRRNNEDSFLALQFDAHEVGYLGKIGDTSLAERDAVFAVSDGMGGANAGEFASRITVEKITRVLPRSFQQAAIVHEQGTDEVLGELFDQIHRALLFLGGSYEECAGMGATLSLCWFTPRAMHFAHIGDSRIYYRPAAGPRMLQITHDDTYVGWLYRQGQINERQARTHPGRNSLQKALGAGHQFTDPQVGTVLCEPGDRFLLCSDGVVDGLYDNRLADFLAAPPAGENPAHELVTEAVAASGRDNTTALLVEVL